MAPCCNRKAPETRSNFSSLEKIYANYNRSQKTCSWQKRGKQQPSLSKLLVVVRLSNSRLQSKKTFKGKKYTIISS